MALLDIFSGKPKITRTPTTQTTTTGGTTSTDQTSRQTGSTLSNLMGTQTGSATSTGTTQQLSGLQDQTLLGPLRQLLGQTQGSATPQQQAALNTLSQTLSGVAGQGTPAGYSAARSGVLQDANQASNIINKGLADSGLSGNAGAGVRARTDLASRTQQNLLNAFDSNRNQQLQNILGLGQAVQGVGDQQRLAPLTAAAGYSTALSPFTRTGSTAQQATQDTLNTQQQQQQQQSIQNVINNLLSKQNSTSTTQGEQINVGPSNFQNLLGLLGGGASLVGALKGGN